MPESKSEAYFRLFKIYLDNSLDLIELEKAKTFIKNEKASGFIEIKSDAI